MPDYLEKMLGPNTTHRTEYSPNNRFLFHTPGSKGGSTELLWLTYRDWLDRANVTDDKIGPDQQHWYFRLIGCGKTSGGHCDKSSSEYLFDELPFFQPTYVEPTSETSLARSTQLYMGYHGDQQHGIHCRFGMKVGCCCLSYSSLVLVFFASLNIFSCPHYPG